MMRWLLCVLLMGVSVSQADDAVLHDPTRPAGWHENRAQPLRLPRLEIRSVVYSGANRFAVINGQVVREGETVSGVRVMRIRPGKVRLNYKGHTFWRQVVSVSDVKKR